MKVSFAYKDGTFRVVDLEGPLRVIVHPHGTMDILHDEGTGWDYWFNKDGSFDGTGMGCEGLSVEEAKGIAEGLKDMQAGRVRSFDEIEKELREKSN